jgi:hypothetical protein
MLLLASGTTFFGSGVMRKCVFPVHKNGDTRAKAKEGGKDAVLEPPSLLLHCQLLNHNYVTYIPVSTT